MLRKIALSVALMSAMLLPSQAEMLSTDSIYAKNSGALVQVRISDRVAGSKSAIGSGFFVGDQGLIATNYHVISELVFHPEDYRAAFYRENGQSGSLALLGVDVVHDLAILRPAETVPSKSLRIAEKNPAHGEKLYSIGNPHDIGMTIVEGTYNGFLKKSLHKKIHFTGSINPGMSGGPVLNQRGNVVGINVSTAGNQMSFLVPAKYLQTLLANLPQEVPDNSAILESIHGQLLANQDNAMRLLSQKPLKTTDFNGFLVPGELTDFLKCWGDRQPEDEDHLFAKVYKYCSSNDNIYLSRDHRTAMIDFRHEVFSTEKMGKIRFSNFLQKRLNRPQIGGRGDEESVTNYHCNSDFVQHDGLDFKVILCLRSYKKFADLYDVFLTANSLSQGDEALHTTLYLSGVSHENALNFPREYLEAISWNQ
jgi:serine protease Do